MEWLSEWIKQIILIVLVATFVDLLLPNQSFDRYVKLVLGLLIIMAILTPILQLLNQDIDFTASRLLELEQPVATLDSLQTIHAKSKQLQAQQLQQIQQTWEQKMEQLLAEDLQQQFSLQNVKVKVKARIQEERTPQILAIEVQAEKGPQQQQKASQQPSSIQPVEAIEVEMGKKQANKQQDHKLSEQIKKYIQQNWKIKEDQVDVTVESDA